MPDDAPLQPLKAYVSRADLDWLDAEAERRDPPLSRSRLLREVLAGARRQAAQPGAPA